LEILDGPALLTSWRAWVALVPNFGLECRVRRTVSSTEFFTRTAQKLRQRPVKRHFFVSGEKVHVDAIGRAKKYALQVNVTTHALESLALQLREVLVELVAIRSQCLLGIILP